MSRSFLMLRPSGELFHTHLTTTDPTDPADSGPGPAILGRPFERLPLNSPHLAAWATNDPTAPGNLVAMLLVAVLGDTIIDLRGTVYFTGAHQGQLTAITDDDVQVIASLRDAAVAALADIGRRP